MPAQFRATWHKRLSRLLEPFLPGKRFSIVRKKQILLNEVDLKTIYQLASRQDARLPGTTYESRDMLFGERLSAFTGGGLEFAEHRRFQTGDSPRHINWRLYGRSGELFVRRFHEERRDQLFLLVDRRCEMWFGTRRRLKVTRAAAQAIYFAWLAERQQFSTAAVIVDDSLTWFARQCGRGRLLPFLQHINRPVSEAYCDTEAPSLNRILSQLPLRVSPGSLIVLVSDFHDLDEHSVGLLYGLAQQHTLVACQIQDPVERQLPTRGRFHIANVHDFGASRVLDCDDPGSRAREQSRLDEKNRQTRSLLERAGARYLLGLTTDDWEDLRMPIKKRYRAI